jgi:hypothetical protein
MIRVRKILIVMALLAAAAPAQTVNCIVAVVNGQIITLLDVDVVAAFGLVPDPAAEPGADPRRAALEALIDRKLILDLARENRAVSADETAQALAGLRRSLGEEGFRARLARFGLTPRDLEPYLEEGLLCERALALRFSQSIPVSVSEIERHYRDIYVPEQTRAGVAPEPLDKVSAAIGSRIRGERRAIQTSAWVRDLRKNADIQFKKDCLK